jgi:lipoprotein NlpI
LASLTKNKSRFKQSLTFLDEVLSADNLSKSQRAEFHSLRGVCHFNLGNRVYAKDDFNESIRLDPQNDLLFDNRAQFWEAIGNDKLADADRARARAIRRKSLEKVKGDD